MKRFLTLAFVFVFLVICACSSNNMEQILADMEANRQDYIDPSSYSLEPATPSPVPSADLTDIPDYKPEGTAEAQPSESAKELAESTLEKMKETDILRYIPADTYQKTESSSIGAVVSADPAIAYALQGKYAEWFNDATGSLFSTQTQELSLSCEAPPFRLLATLAYNYSGEPDKLRQVLYDACDFSITKGIGDPLTITATPKDPVDFFYSQPADGEHPAISNLLSYAYLNTVYDNQLEMREGIGEPALAPLVFPMENPEYYYFTDTWYADRDGGARRHTGTDINAPKGTPLLACADGSIKDVGTNAGAGNYIVLEGADGTQYHYYHMENPSMLAVGTKVTAGVTVGAVGNTGNSTANHLHFSIITADGYYVNPYAYLLAAQESEA